MKTYIESQFNFPESLIWMFHSRTINNKINRLHKRTLTLNIPYISESCIEKKIGYVFIFTLFCGALNGFMKTLKVFIKPFEGPQGSVKIKIELNFFSLSGIGTGEVKDCLF